MKILHVPFCFAPDPHGGTEVYVEALARHLREDGVDAVIAAPGRRNAAYEHEGLAVRRFAVSETIEDLEAFYGDGDPRAAAVFADILADERPDLVHLHALTYGVSACLAREVQRRGLPLVFTNHLPPTTCQRGTLLRWGTEVCAGRLDLDLCTRCTLHGLGMPRGAAGFVGRVPVAVGHAFGAAGLSGGAWTALRMRALVHARHRAVRAVLTAADRVVAVCQWVEDLLLRNDIPASKLVLCRQGVADTPSGPPAPPTAAPQLRVAFLGRLESTKGLHVLVEAIRRVPDLPMQLDVYGVPQEGSAAYLQRLRALLVGDGRVRFHAPIPSRTVVERLARYDVVAVPSQWLETGPLVVLEAFAAGTPVLGADRGGIAELVRPEVDGVLVDPGVPDAWAQALARLHRDRSRLATLRAGIRPPRTMRTVAHEMAQLYDTVLAARQACSRV